MKNKTKNIIVTFGFVLSLIFILLINIVAEDKEISITERRSLTQFPEVSISKLFNGEVTGNFENYAVDQFVGRDFFRYIKAFIFFYYFVFS